MARVLAIDPGSHMGWARVADGDLVASDCWRLHEDGERPGVRFFRLFHRLAENYAAFGKPDIVVYETKFAIPGAGTRNLLVTGGYIGVIGAFCEEVRVHDVRSLAPSTVKKRIAGHGRASKAQMIEAARRLSGRPIEDDNEADAVCLAFAIHEEIETT